MKNLRLINRIYKEYGETMRYVQTYESKVLSLAITVEYLNSYPNDPLIKNYEKIFSKKALGILIEFLKSKLNFDEKSIKTFKNCNDKRIYLAHHFYNKIDIYTLDDSDKRKIIKELN